MNASGYAFSSNDPHVISLSMQSPLKLRLGVSASKKTINALVPFIGNILFYKEKQQLMQVEIAIGWEHVIALLLKNVETVIELATSADTTPPEKIKHPNDHQIHTLLEAALKMEHSELKLTRIDVSDDK